MLPWRRPPRQPRYYGGASAVLRKGVTLVFPRSGNHLLPPILRNRLQCWISTCLYLKMRHGQILEMNLSKATILLAEDEANDIFFMERCFEKARLLNPLRIVNDGEQAMAYLAGEGKYGDRNKFPFPILLLLDLRMPRKSGFEVLEWLCAQEGLRRLTTVVLTSSKEGPDVNRAYDLGANSYLVKPPQPEALTEMFQRLNSYWVALNVLPDCQTGSAPGSC